MNEVHAARRPSLSTTSRSPSAEPDAMLRAPDAGDASCGAPKPSSRAASTCSSACDVSSGEDAWLALDRALTQAQVPRDPSAVPTTPSALSSRASSPWLQRVRLASPAASEVSSTDTAVLALFDGDESLTASADEADGPVGLDHLDAAAEAAESQAVAEQLLRPACRKTSLLTYAPHLYAVCRGIGTGVAIGLLMGFALHARAATSPPGALERVQGVVAQQAARLREGLLPQVRGLGGTQLRQRLMELAERLAELSARGVRLS